MLRRRRWRKDQAQIPEHIRLFANDQRDDAFVATLQALYRFDERKWRWEVLQPRLSARQVKKLHKRVVERMAVVDG